ncbi:hypothetical protein ACN38_g11901 [Penicillium nordicum]|uniref:Uncharacterized protein n=1 Tax=Penicillium nordicum TaxID=229535 RepID=A0A0M8NY07_9EURO|nr:hypothetical protein ACN38_g11901 [Penicillium nordicum]
MGKSLSKKKGEKKGEKKKRKRNRGSVPGGWGIPAGGDWSKLHLLTFTFVCLSLSLCLSLSVSTSLFGALISYYQIGVCLLRCRQSA